MTQRHKIQLFEDKKVRTAWDDEREEWYFSIVDVCGVLTESKDPQAYWRKLKQRLKDEGNETVTNCHALKMRAADGKMRMTDVADTEQMFRIIQSIPSKKAEPFKQWMASVAKQRLDQMADPELAIGQAVQDWRRKGYSENWINNRVKSIEVRKALTDEWDRAGVQQGMYRRCRKRRITKIEIVISCLGVQGWKVERGDGYLFHRKTKSVIINS